MLLVVAGVLVCVTSFRDAFSASSRASRASRSEVSEHPTTNKSGINRRSNRFTSQIVAVRDQALPSPSGSVGDWSYIKALEKRVHSFRNREGNYALKNPAA